MPAGNGRDPVDIRQARRLSQWARSYMKRIRRQNEWSRVVHGGMVQARPIGLFPCLEAPSYC